MGISQFAQGCNYMKDEFNNYISYRKDEIKAELDLGLISTTEYNHRIDELENMTLKINEI